MKKRKFEVFDIINIIILTLVSAIILLPIMTIISQSLMSNQDIMKYGYTLLPKNISWESYKYLLLKNSAMRHGFLVSVGITVVGTFSSLLVTSMYAYGISKKDLPFRGFFTVCVLITMIFSGGLIPRYLVVTSLGLKNNYLSLIIPVLMVAWNALILRNFFQAIPGELFEAARIDGADEMTLFFKVALPLSKSAIATIGLFYAVKYWNAWFDASIFLSDKSKWPMQLLLKEIMNSLQIAASSGAVDSIAATLPTESIKAAAIVITALPIVLVYPFIQKYFVRGVMVGSVKG
ncbi:MAG: carbohydrate ABC transporter permease [Lachnospiraceae bacterium]|nr:MAG: carbohydrate ABC transporter permease [Lachnospiraceae bacterium]